MKRMMIESGDMGQKKEVKLEDIADSLGVSIVTVSNALKGKKGVSEGLRNRIKEAAQRMGYKTPVYEEKEKERSHIIGVLVAERYVKEFPSFYMEIYRRVAQETAKRGHVTAILRLANAMDRSHYQKVKGIKAVLKDRELQMIVDSAQDISLELGLLKDKEAFFEEVFGIRLVLRRKGRA